MIKEECFKFIIIKFFFFFSSRRRHTRSCLVSWARRCVQETDIQLSILEQMLIDKRVQKEIIKEYIKPCYASLQFQMNVINDILDYAFIQQGQFRKQINKCNLKKVLQEIKKIIKQQIKKRSGLVFTYEVDDKIPDIINNDKQRIKQILLNFVSNALKVTLKGEIAIKMTLQDFKYIKVAICDTGYGIPEDKLQEIIQSFQVLCKVGYHSNDIKVGLGLKITQILVKLLAPKQKQVIQVSSEFGKGTTFQILLSTKSR
eukprot:TRINITY_DN8154_c0_g1_i4.p2 TRINITY_DN8154_c0_g1~~TRINITY_DN8154_c0_g1_i4.p2  ORF type:complete len:258 (+),score=50.98 TRINITY_DN8154_c0_g1_i4:2-775(+)